MTQVGPTALDLDDDRRPSESERHMLLEIERGLRFAATCPALPINPSAEPCADHRDDYLELQDLASDVLQAGELLGFMDIELCRDSLQMWQDLSGSERAPTFGVPAYSDHRTQTVSGLRDAIKRLRILDRTVVLIALVEIWARGETQQISPDHLAFDALRGARLTREDLGRDVAREQHDDR